jgi:hypothetical protein
MSPREHARAVLAAVKIEIAQAHQSLQQRGFFAAEPELTTRIGRDGEDDIELTVRFHRQTDQEIVDVLEFHVVEGGTATVSVSEAAEWARANLPSVGGGRAHDQGGDDVL